MDKGHPFRLTVAFVVIALAASALGASCSSSGSGRRGGAATTEVAPAVPATPGPYLPLFPFSSAALVQQWQASFAARGYQAWHLDAGLTAREFAGWLGYDNARTVITETSDAGGARVALGVPGKGTAAVVRLVHWGGGRHAPWEVVGTETTGLAVDTPAYASSVGSPVTVAGTTTPTSGSVSLQARSLASGPVGSYCCVAGSTGSWRATVSFSAPAGTVVVLAVHASSVETFAVTGVKAG